MRIVQTGPVHFVLIEKSSSSDNPYFPHAVIRSCAWSANLADVYSLQKLIRYCSCNCMVAKELSAKSPKLFSFRVSIKIRSIISKYFLTKRWALTRELVSYKWASFKETLIFY
jgi:hypothetical protein